MYSDLKSISKVSQCIRINELQRFDVLCGNDVRFDSHPGNIRYQENLSKARLLFANSDSKSAQKKLIRGVDDLVSSYGGRFLKFDEAACTFQLLSKAETRNKISRALREKKTAKYAPKIYISKIKELDVVCGRGGKANRHLG